MRNPWNTDSDDIPSLQTGQSSRFTYMAVLLWGLVFASISVFYLSSTNFVEIVDLFQFGARSVAVAVVTVAMLALLFKLLRYVGMGMKVVKRLFVLSVLLTLLALVTGII